MTTIGDRLARVRACARTRLRLAGQTPRAEFRTERPRTVTEGGDRLSICRRCGWTHGGPGCRAAHRLNLATRMWSRREWLRYRRTGRLPIWDYPSRRDRRRARRGR
jgi:hypothetical protein